VQVEKNEVVELLRARGEHDKAANVECALPQQVDTERDAGLLHAFDVSTREVAEADAAAPTGGATDRAEGSGADS
jgi:hypothetical protein